MVHPDYQPSAAELEEDVRVPKDTAALSRIAEEAGSPSAIVDAVLRSNDARKAGMVGKIAEACGGSVAGKTVAVLGVTFKPNTDDVSESPSLVILPGLMGRGAVIRAFDPAGMEEARRVLDGVVGAATLTTRWRARTRWSSSPSGTSSGRSTWSVSGAC